MYKYIKRALDFCAALGAIIVLSPVLLIVALLVKTKLGSPVLFKQERPGMIDKKTGEEKIFTLCKFRTMTDERDENGELLPDEIRLTKFGQFLRSTSIDELPEFINILKGDMSFIGPRPLLVRYLPLYSDEQHRRHLVRPGLSGWAQVNGRNTVSWEEKFNLDVEYVDKMSFSLDVKIFFMTIMSVLKREGISSETSATMEEFKGNKVEETTEV
ncbi:MAG: sugar transferase [Clostridia bacterium]|nr:sugar transferase [Clostridia bacterium]